MNVWFTGRPWEPEDLSDKQTEHATSLRVPFLATPYPRWNYISGIVINEDLYRAVMPTDEEVEQVATIIAAYKDYFFPHPNPYRREMEAYAPYDIDGGAASFYLIKRQDGGWAYRKGTWWHSVAFQPAYDSTPLTLDELIDQAGLYWKRS